MANPAENPERQAWVSAGMAISQPSAGTWLLVLLLIGAPKWLLLALLLLSFALGAVSLSRRHRRSHMIQPTRGDE